MSAFPSVYRMTVEEAISSVPANKDEDTIKYARRERLHFFWEPDNWGLWSSPNATSLPTPVHRPNIDDDHGMIRDYFRRPQKIRWLQALQPFLAFWPLRPEWTGPFLTLNLINGRVPVSIWQDGTGWHLYANLVTSWCILEANLVKLATHLLRRHITARYEWSEIRASTLPYEFGYRGAHKTANDAIRAAYTSRNAFVILSSYVSFTIALDMAIYPMEEGMAPSWLAYAETELGMDPVWLNELNDSFVCNFTPGFRPGAYVHASISTYKQAFVAFAVANVPLYICWGFGRKWIRNDDPIVRYRPCRAEAEEAVQRYADKRNREVSDELSGSFLSVHKWSSTLVTDDLPLQGGGTFGNEEYEFSDPYKDGPHVHLARLAKERIEVMRHESEDEVRNRIDVESKAEVERVDESCVEPSTGESLYQWCECGREVFSRRGIHRNDWKSIWGLYKPDERHFSADYSEWNLFPLGDGFVADDGQFPEDPRATAGPPANQPTTLLESNLGTAPPPGERQTTTADDDIIHLWKSQYSADVTYGDDESDYGSEDEGRPKKRKKNQTPTTSRKRSLQRDNRTARHIVEHNGRYPRAGQPINPALLIDEILMPDAKTTLREKYRYTMPEPYATDHRMTEAHDHARHLANGQVIPGLTAAPKTALRRIGMEAVNTPEITQGLIDFYNYFIVATKVFPPLWDLAPTRLHEIVHHSYFHYVRIGETLHVIGVRDRPLIEQWYLLIIHDARAVVELFNTSRSSIGELVRYLIQSGIRFSTAKPVRRPPRPPPTSFQNMLGYRQKKYNFDRTDYQDYQMKRAYFLSGSGGRAALTRGGILWRLAKGQVKDKRITAGPTSSVAWSGEIITELDGRYLIDDTLSEAEEGLVCGVYKVYTGAHTSYTINKWG
jgi:hypothetical protein